MDYAATHSEGRSALLQALGVENIDSLLGAVPEGLKLPAPQIDDGMSESEGLQIMERLAEENTFLSFDHYLGAGAYSHYIPAFVSSICSLGPFLTSYTPYQAEISQGMLQAIFEYQSAICAITGLEVSNASLYDGASACAEAVLMALRCRPGRTKIMVASGIHPHYRAVIEQYTKHLGVNILTVPHGPDGLLDREFLEGQVDEQTAAALLPYPSLFGIVEDFSPLIKKVRSHSALAVVVANPMVYGLFASAGDLGADIAVGDAQPLGIALQCGGPYVGYLACREDLVRQLPGRLVGETVDSEGKRGFVLTLQAREQHIRREKATSNICTNQALNALAVLAYTLWYGPKGLYDLALANYQRAAYLKESLSRLPHVRVLPAKAHFNEIAVFFDQEPQTVQSHFRSCGIEPGWHLGTWYPQWHRTFLIAVNEQKTKQQLDRYVEVAASLGGSRYG